MKKINKVILIIVVVLLIVLISVYVIFKSIRKNRRYEMSQINIINTYEGNIDLRHIIKDKSDAKGVAKTLVLAIEGYNNWNELALSDKFKNKYHDWHNLIDERDKYYSLMPYSENINGKEIAAIFADTYGPVIETSSYSPIAYIYYYEYIVNENNELDDINLIKKVKVDATTENVIEELKI